MSIPPDLRAILACPRCKGPVEETGDGAGLLCPACGLVYPVEDGIPIMLEEEARSVSSPTGDGGSRGGEPPDGS